MNRTDNDATEDKPEDVPKTHFKAENVPDGKANTSTELSPDQEVLSGKRRIQDKIPVIEAVDSSANPRHKELLPSRSLETHRDNAHKDDETFEPCLFFFYGTLMDPAVLMTVAGLDKLPELEDGWITGFEMKMWNGMYPTLIPREDGTNRIDGKAWKATTMDQTLRLQLYETSAYEACYCVVHLGREELVKALTFKWAGDLESSELTRGCLTCDTDRGIKNQQFCCAKI